MEWLTDAADIKMQVGIRSLMNNFIKDYPFENKPYVITFIRILQIFLTVAYYSAVGYM